MSNIRITYIYHELFNATRASDRLVHPTNGGIRRVNSEFERRERERDDEGNDRRIISRGKGRRGEKVASLEMRVSLEQWAKGGERVEAGGELGLERGER